MSQLTIVTGGAGFIGGHLVERLARSGQTVRVIERPGTDVSYLPAEVEVVFVDIRDRDALASALKVGPGFTIWLPILTCGRGIETNSKQ